MGRSQRGKVDRAPQSLCPCSRAVLLSTARMSDARGTRTLPAGRSDAGRYLMLVFERKPGSVIRVYSARDMTEAEKYRFRKLLR